MLFISLHSFSQSLSTERVDHIKKCTVKVTVEGMGSGTGFLIDNKGTILTCWHVLQPVLIISNNQISGYRKIIVEFNNGQKSEYVISAAIINKAGKVLVSYDICTIKPEVIFKTPTDFLKIGSYSNLKEGEEVITCGYPFGIPKAFITKGIVSTKLQDTSAYVDNTSHTLIRTPVNHALMDITMNKGNSGGPVIKLGNSILTDEVIGVADFIITPVGQDITNLLGDLNKANNSGGSVQIMGIDPNQSMSKIAQVLTNISNGISGCVSIEYLKNLNDSIR